MDERFVKLTLYALGATALVAGLAKGKSRLELSRAKHRSLAGHARMARHVASLVPFYEFGEEQFFRSDDAPDDIAARRRNGFMRLAQLYRERFAETRRLTAEAREGISDLQFTDAYRVPFQYSRMVREYLRAGSFLKSSEGVTFTNRAWSRATSGSGSWGRCSAPTTRSWPTMLRG